MNSTGVEIIDLLTDDGRQDQPALDRNPDLAPAKPKRERTDNESLLRRFEETHAKSKETELKQGDSQALMPYKNHTLSTVLPPAGGPNSCVPPPNSNRVLIAPPHPPQHQKIRWTSCYNDRQASFFQAILRFYDLDTQIRFKDLTTANLSERLEFEVYLQEVVAIFASNVVFLLSFNSFMPEGWQLFGGFSDGTIGVWITRPTGNDVWCPHVPYALHSPHPSWDDHGAVRKAYYSTQVQLPGGAVQQPARGQAERALARVAFSTQVAMPLNFDPTTEVARKFQAFAGTRRFSLAPMPHTATNDNQQQSAFGPSITQHVSHTARQLNHAEKTTVTALVTLGNTASNVAAPQRRGEQAMQQTIPFPPTFAEQCHRSHGTSAATQRLHAILPGNAMQLDSSITQSLPQVHPLPPDIRIHGRKPASKTVGKTLTELRQDIRKLVPRVARMGWLHPIILNSRKKELDIDDRKDSLRAALTRLEGPDERAAATYFRKEIKKPRHSKKSVRFQVPDEEQAESSEMEVDDMAELDMREAGMICKNAWCAMSLTPEEVEVGLCEDCLEDTEDREDVRGAKNDEEWYGCGSLFV